MALFDAMIVVMLIGVPFIGMFVFEIIDAINGR